MTSSGKIELAPPPLLADVARLKAVYLERAPGNGRLDLSLIGRRQLRSNNSWMHNYKRLVKGKERCTLLIHPSDAAARQLSAGQTAEVSSRVGRVRLPVEISDEMMPGVVSIPHGWGHDRPGVRLQVAQAHPGASINDLTDDQFLDAFTGNAALSGVAVAVTAVD